MAYSVTFDDYPTEDQLERIRSWDYTEGFEGLGEFVCNIWHFSDWAEFKPPHRDEYKHLYRELRLATAGWSGNEDIVGALYENQMFRMLCWQSSHRGGLHIYHIPLKENDPSKSTK